MYVGANGVLKVELHERAGTSLMNNMRLNFTSCNFILSVVLLTWYHYMCECVLTFLTHTTCSLDSCILSGVVALLLLVKLHCFIIIISHA